MTQTLGFLHVADVQAEYFENVVREAAGGEVETHHLVDTSLLEMAREQGVDEPNVVAEVESAAATLFDFYKCRVVACTCSTIGGIVERMTSAQGTSTARIDRAMADAATANGGRVLVVAALESTLEPTRELLLDSARRQGTSPELELVVSDGAWPHFEAGRQDDYLAAIAETVNTHAAGFDSVVLAQASMADAAERCAVDVPVLASPRLGVEAALALLTTGS